MENLGRVINNTVVAHKVFSNAIDTYDQAISAIGSMNNSIAFTLVGDSRVGKTTLLTYLKSKYSPKRNEEGVIHPVAYCCVPPQPSLRGLAISLLKGLNDPLLDSQKTSGESGERALKTRALKLIKECSVKAIILDESQHLTRAPESKTTYAATEWIKTLLDETNLVLIMAGLNSTTNLFDQNEQLMGRCMSTVRLSRFDWVDSESRSEFLGTLYAFQQKMRDFDLPELTEHDMSFRFYLATGGLLGYLSKLLTQAVWDAITEKRTVMKMEHFAVAYEKTMRVSDANNAINPFIGSQLQATAERVAMAKGVGVHIPAPRQSTRRKITRS